MTNRVRHVSIKARLIILSLIGLIGFSAILVGNLSFFKKTNEKLSTLQSTDLRMVQIASELQVGLTDLNRLFEAAVVEIDEDTLADALKLAEAQKRQITALGQLTNGMQDQHRILANTFDRYVAENRAYVEDVIAGRYAGDAMYSAFSSALQRREDYDQLLRGMTRNINANFTGTLQLLRDSSIDATERQFTFAALLFLLFALAIIWFIRMITQAIDNVIGVAGQIADGNLDVQVDTSGSEEFRRLFGALDVMRGRLKQQYVENEQRQKRQQQLAQLNESLRGEKTEQTLGDNILSCLAQQMGALVGAFYLYEQNELVLKASYAYTVRKAGHNRFALGESLVGQAALEQKLIIVRDLPADYTPVASGLGEAVPAECCCCR
ncbi:MAG: HAMP domain-containing protein [Gammaproteobacteria bacterium]